MKNISDEEFTRLYNNWELTLRDIAEAVGCSYGAVNYRVHKLGLAGTRPVVKSSQWVRKNQKGYIMLRTGQDNPMAARSGVSRHTGEPYYYVFEHRAVMARHLGRPLEPWEDVHHINGVRDDNRIENLELWSDAERAQPAGVRAEDQIAHAVETLRRLAPELLSEGGNNA